MPSKRCNAPLCRTLIDYRQQYCKEHAQTSTRKQETYSERKEKDSEALKFYKSKQWQRTSRNYRYKHPVCEVCKEIGIVSVANVVDHIKERKDLLADEQHLLYDESNLMSLCHTCHNRKTAAERIKRKT
ncbi:HNH endonuclease signature motif containing protein [Kurthia senegalensis]|uniref:HNH endonuclease signature motif containing protein n=1 Tax=Kurthia senegalensis TaxID=1033740 RepID=UPI0002882B87|nr:HNH endonuclease signature motif containing protein [Kurthia senegalensis]